MRESNNHLERGQAVSVGIVSPPRPRFTVTVDTEEQWNWSAGYTTDSSNVENIDGLPRFQQECENLGAKVTYYVNYSVLANSHARGIIRDLNHNPNAEIGLHYHPWNTPPLSSKRIVEVRETFMGNLPWEVTRSKLDSILDLFYKAGLQPNSFRGGRYSTSQRIQEYLYNLGFTSDFSFLPYCRWADDGAPDYSDRGYLPIRKTFSGKTGFWELPLTRGFTRGDWDRMARWYQGLEANPWSKLRLIGMMERLGICERIWLNFEEGLGSKNLKLIPVLNRRRLVAINFTIHSSSLVPGASCYVPDKNALESLYCNLRLTLKQLQNDAVYQSATVSELVNQLERQFHANTRN